MKEEDIVEQAKTFQRIIDNAVLAERERCERIVSNIEYDDEHYIITPVVQRILTMIKAIKDTKG